jgi:hypothetical protein
MNSRIFEYRLGLPETAVSRRRFLKISGVAGASAAAAAMGLGRIARAQSTYSLPVTANPDPGQIRVVSPDFIEVYPVGDSEPERRTLLEAGREEDPRISIIDEALLFGSGFQDWMPLSETGGADPDSPWDTRRRTRDVMNVEWAVNNVQKQLDGSPGTVTLKARKFGDSAEAPTTPFEFGSDYFPYPYGYPGNPFPSGDLPPGTGVIVCNDSIIRGEVGRAGQPSTTIKRGLGCFVVNWWQGSYLPWIYGYLEPGGWPPLPGSFGVHLWHDFATEKVVFRDLILEDSTYPHLYTRSGADVSDSERAYPLTYAEADNFWVVDGALNPYGFEPIPKVNVPILFEHQEGTSVVKNCNLTTTDEPGNLVIGIATASSRSEITNNTVFIPAAAPPDPDVLLYLAGIRTASIGSTLIRNNDVAVESAAGVGLAIESDNSTILNNRFYGGSDGILVLGSDNLIRNVDFTQLDIQGQDNTCITLGVLVDHDQVLSRVARDNQIYVDAGQGTKYFPPGTTMCDQIVDVPDYDPPPPDGSGCGEALFDGEPGYFSRELIWDEEAWRFLLLPGHYVPAVGGPYVWDEAGARFIPAIWIGVPGTHDWEPDCTAYPKNNYIHHWDRLCQGGQYGSDRLAHIRKKLTNREAALEAFLKPPGPHKGE